MEGDFYLDCTFMSHKNITTSLKIYELVWFQDSGRLGLDTVYQAAATFFRAFPVKNIYTFNKLHGVTLQKTLIFTFNDVKTSNVKVV